MRALVPTTLVAEGSWAIVGRAWHASPYRLRSILCLNIRLRVTCQNHTQLCSKSVKLHTEIRERRGLLWHAKVSSFCHGLSPEIHLGPAVDVLPTFVPVPCQGGFCYASMISTFHRLHACQATDQDTRTSSTVPYPSSTA